MLRAIPFLFMLLASCASPRRGDPFFGTLGMQLAQTPNESLAKLQEKPKRAPTSVTDGALEVNSAEGWAKLILKRAYQPPKGTAFVMFPKERGKYDVIRASYRVGLRHVEIAQSRYVFSVRIDGERACSTSTAEAVAREAIATPKSMRLIMTAGRPGFQLGKSNVPPPPTEATDWGADWVSEMRWWCGKGALGFLTLKAAGDPAASVAALDEELNKNWF